MTDGRRDCITRSVATFDKLIGPISVRVMHDDSGDPNYRDWLWDTFGSDGWVIHSTGERSGFGGAYRSAWRWLREHDRNPFVMATEDDFEIRDPVRLHDLMQILDTQPHVAQVALLRQAWNADERRAGGIIEQHPRDYHDRTDGTLHWLEHRRFYTTNPSLVRRRLILEHDWPVGGQSEGRFSARLFKNPATVSAFYGQRQDPPRVTHIGRQRVGTGY